MELPFLSLSISRWCETSIVEVALPIWPLSRSWVHHIVWLSPYEYGGIQWIMQFLVRNSGLWDWLWVVCVPSLGYLHAKLGVEKFQCSPGGKPRVCSGICCARAAFTLVAANELQAIIVLRGIGLRTPSTSRTTFNSSGDSEADEWLLAGYRLLHFIVLL